MKILIFFSQKLQFFRKLKVKNRRKIFLNQISSKGRIICDIIQTLSTGHENNLYGAKVWRT